MTRTRSTLLLLALAFALSVPAAAKADGGIKVGWYSQQVHPSRAAVGGHIDASTARASATRDKSSTPAGTAQRLVVTIRTAHAGPNLPPPFPPLSTSASILRYQHPGGPGSFWYTDTAGHACQYVPDSVTPCFTLVGPGANSSAGGLSPSAVAESLTRRVELAPGQINSSPARAGLTGAPS